MDVMNVEQLISYLKQFPKDYHVHLDSYFTFVDEDDNLREMILKTGVTGISYSHEYKCIGFVVGEPKKEEKTTFIPIFTP